MTARPSDVPADPLPPDLRLRDDQAQVWLARVHAGRLDDDLRQALSADLDDVTLAKAARFRRAQDRDRALAAHAVLRRLLATIVDAAPRELVFGTWCRACGSREHGKPFLTGFGDAAPQFNLSHSGELIGVALAGPGLDLGIDVESRRRSVDWTALRRSVFADQEWARTQAGPDPDGARTDGWSRKEASVKATGHGLATPLRAVLISAAGADDTVWTARIAARTDPDGTHPEQHLAGWDISGQRSVAEVAEGYAAVVAVRVPGPPGDGSWAALLAPLVRLARL